MEARFGLFGASANLDARQVYSLHKRTIYSEINWTHPIELLDDVCHMESYFDPFGDSVSFGVR